MPNKRIHQQLKVMARLDKFDQTIIATLRSVNPNKGYPCFIFRVSELEKMKTKYGKNLYILSESLEGY